MPDFVLLANSLALDLVNTTIVASGRPVDLCPTWDHFVDWLVATGVAGGSEATRLRRSPRAAEHQIARVHAFRAFLRSTCESVSEFGRVPEGALGTINAEIADRPLSRVLVRRDGVVTREQARPRMEPEDCLSVVADAAADLFAMPDLARLRRCSNPACVLWFLDTSKNGARRWCSMDLCGNRTKAAAFHRRHKDGGA